jgi:hypothetical protein
VAGSIWRDSNFRPFWLAETISNRGTAFTELALPLTAVILLRASAFDIGLLEAPLPKIRAITSEPDDVAAG